MKSRFVLPMALFAILFFHPPSLVQASEVGLNLSSAKFAKWEPKNSPINLKVQSISKKREEELSHFGSGITELIFRSKITLQKDGTTKEAITRAIQFLSESGIRSHGNQEIFINAYRETLTFHRAYVVLPNGEKITVKSDTVQITADAVDNVFSDSYRAVIPFPSLTTGAITVLEYSLVRRQDELGMPWTRMFLPQQLHAIENFQVNVYWQEESLRPSWKTDFAQLNCQKQKIHLITCLGTQIDPYQGDPDINYLDVLPTLMFATPTTWKKISNKIQSIVTKSQSGNSLIQKQLNQILNGAISEEDKLSRIHSFVSREIRYVALSHGNRGILPMASFTTLSRRYGDCKDKTTLFLDFAKLAGIEAYPVLISSSRKNLSKFYLPSHFYFDHMVACGNLRSGMNFCVDLTDPFSGFDTMPGNIQGTIGLKIQDPTSQPKQMPLRRNRWQLEVESHYVFDYDGNLSERQNRNYVGAYAAQIRTTLATLSKEEITKLAVEDYQQNVSDTVSPDFTFQGIDDQQSNLLFQSFAVYKNFTSPKENLNYVQSAGWGTKLAGNFQSTNERHPYHFPGFLYKSVHHYSPSDNQKFTNLGPTLNFISTYGKLIRSYVLEKGNLIVTTSIDVPQAVILTSEIKTFNRFIKIIQQQSPIRFYTVPKKIAIE